MFNYIQGEKFHGLGELIYSPSFFCVEYVSEHRTVRADESCLIKNTFSIENLKEINTVYTHIFYVKYFFDIIRKLKNKFILITHDGDMSIDDRLDIPENVIKWFGINVNTKDPRVESIPIGIENRWQFPEINRVAEIDGCLKKPKNIKNLLYINHNINNNPNERLEPYELFAEKSWATLAFGRDGINFKEYINNIYDHKFVICPAGQGFDTYRLWECLYLNTIPIEKRNINNQFYTDLPICFVDDWKEITLEFLEFEYQRITNELWNLEKLDFNYWKNKIISEKLRYI
jgi:hypothetical protein